MKVSHLLCEALCPCESSEQGGSVEDHGGPATHESCCHSYGAVPLEKEVTRQLSPWLIPSRFSKSSTQSLGSWKGPSEATSGNERGGAEREVEEAKGMGRKHMFIWKRFWLDTLFV